MYFTSKERGFFNKSLSKFQEDLILWKWPNILLPLTFLFFSIIVVSFINSQKQPNDFTGMSILNLFVNGCLPLFAMNRLGSIISLSHNIDRNKDKQVNEVNIPNLRTKLQYFYLFSIILSISFYIVQVSFSPFKDFFFIVLNFLGSLFLLIYSIYLARRFFILQDNYISFSDNISQEANKNKNVLKETFGE